MTTDQRHSVSVAGVVVDGQGRRSRCGGWGGRRGRDNARWERTGGVLELGEASGGRPPAVQEHDCQVLF